MIRKNQKQVEKLESDSLLVAAREASTQDEAQKLEDSKSIRIVQDSTLVPAKKV